MICHVLDSEIASRSVLYKLRFLILEGCCICTRVYWLVKAMLLSVFYLKSKFLYVIMIIIHLRCFC